jgi:hypothetical protein
MFKRLLFSCLMLISPCVWATTPHGGTAQQLTVNDIEGNTIYIGTQTSSSPMSEFNSTSSGILLPELTTTQMDNIGSPQTGELLYNTSVSAFMFYNGSGWSNVAAPSTTGSSILAGNGNGGLANVTLGSGLSYNSGTQTLSISNNVWVPNNIQAFTSSGTWTKPSNVSTVYVKVIGDGGGGPGDGGGGGGCGGYAEGTTTVTGNVTVTVGSGGSLGGGSSNGSAGTGSSFAGSTTISATGGGGGTHGSTGSGGAGGAGSNGSVNLTGNAGATAVSSVGAGCAAGWFGPYGLGGSGTGSSGSGTAGSGGIVIVYY